MLNKVKEFKILAEYLFKVSDDLEFIKVVLKALQTEEEIMGMKSLLEQSPGIVPAEIYDSLIELTNGRFEKKFTKARYLKQKYLRKPDEEVLSDLLKQLMEDGIFLLAEWNLTDEEYKTMEKAKIDDIVHIKTEVNPVLFISEDGETIYVYVYTSKIEIPKVRFSEYAIQQTTMNYILTLVKSIKDTSGKKVILLLDYDSDDNLVITDEML